MAMIGGALLDIGGTALLGESAEGHRDEFMALMNALGKPDVGALTGDYFDDLRKYAPEATKLTEEMRARELEGSLALREKALPGITKATQQASQGVFDLMQGNVPKSVMDAFSRAGGASTVGLGFGGSDFGFINTGLYGARGALGAMQTGFGLLPTLLSTMPAVSTPSPMAFLGQIMSPGERVNMEMQLRQQQIGINSAYSQMPTRMDVWGTSLKQAGGQMMGMGMGGFGGGGGEDAPKRAPSGNPTPGFAGSSGGAEYFNVPVSSGSIWGGGY